jgi:hypothetical protein
VVGPVAADAASLTEPFGVYNRASNPSTEDSARIP